MKKATASGTVIYHYDQRGRLIAETTEGGDTTSEYVYLNGAPYAKIENNNVYYYHTDHLGTPVVMTDANQNVVWRGEFMPFGEALSITGTITNNLRFPGQYYDEETGLHQNWHRGYKPEVGRYIEADPEFQLNAKRGSFRIFMLYQRLLKYNEYALYVYCVNNPIILFDQFGLHISPYESLVRNGFSFISCRVERGGAQYNGLILTRVCCVGTKFQLSCPPVVKEKRCTNWYWALPDIPRG